MHNDLIPSQDRIFSWIEEIFTHGVRRPGYPADRWAEDWLQQQFRAFSLERVRAEPVAVAYWEPHEAALAVDAPGATLNIPRDRRRSTAPSPCMTSYSTESPKPSSSRGPLGPTTPRALTHRRSIFSPS